MNRTEHICLLATYNEWMNTRLYETAMSLSEMELVTDRKAPFGSMIGILNHLVVGDTLWLKRFAAHPANYAALEPILNLSVPTSLDQILFADIQSLSNHRKLLDQVITKLGHSIKDDDLEHVLTYTNVKGVVAHKNFFGLLMHFFNHQTHHRGQVTTLLWQSNADVGVTDLLALVPN